VGKSLFVIRIFFQNVNFVSCKMVHFLFLFLFLFLF
jgi:hypothetical protein